MYEIFDHTADLGLRMTAADLDGLFAEAGRALTSVIVEDVDSVEPAEESRFEISGSEREDLLLDWLNELLYRFESAGRLFSRFEVRIDERGLKGSAFGEIVDPARHSLTHEVKAITYHHLKVEPTDDGWLAEVIVDI